MQCTLLPFNSLQVLSEVLYRQLLQTVSSSLPLTSSHVKRLKHTLSLLQKLQCLIQNVYLTDQKNPPFRQYGPDVL